VFSDEVIAQLSAADATLCPTSAGYKEPIMRPKFLSVNCLCGSC